MFFNFIINDGGDTTLEDLDVTPVQAESEADAILIYILNDIIDRPAVITLMLNVLSGDSKRQKSHTIAKSLCDKFQKSTGLELADIDDNNIEDQAYKQLLYDNLDEIADLFNEISDGTRGYFQIFQYDNILTASTAKSAVKQ